MRSVCPKLTDSALLTIYRAVVVAKLIYASSAYAGFTTANDRQQIQTFILHCKQAGFCASELDNIDKICISADNQLFIKI